VSFLLTPWVLIESGVRITLQSIFDVSNPSTGQSLQSSFFRKTLYSRSWMEVFHNVLSVLQGHWLGNFFLNLSGYALMIIVPAALIIRRLKKNPSVEKIEKGYKLVVN